eukprot:gene5456-6138_t
MATAASITPKKGNINNAEVGGKIIRDPVHGLMYFPQPVVKVMDTVEVQRLREIKQLGATYLVYPGATHTRFDHALGTAHLCDKMLNSLKERDEDHRITKHNVMLVQIAALCQDLGQGPLSSVYKHSYLEKLKEENWHENTTTIQIFEKIIKNPNIRRVFEKFKIDADDIEFMKDAITGEVPARPKKDRFLYEVVINKRIGIDCSTFDMLLRDSYFLGINTNFDYTMFIYGCSIRKVDNEYVLSLRHKDKFEFDLLCTSYWTLQHKAYIHKTTTAIAMMLAEVLRQAEDVFQIFEARNNADILLTLTDSIIARIEHCEDSRLHAAKEIIKRIKERRIYSFCGQTSPTDFIEKSEQHAFCKKVVKELITKEDGQEEEPIEEDDVLVVMEEISYGTVSSDVTANKPHYVNKHGKPIVLRKTSSLWQYSPDQKSRQNSVSSNRGSFSSCNDNAETTPSGHYEKIAETGAPIPGQAQNPLKIQYIRAYARNAAKRETIIKYFYAYCTRKMYPVPIDTEKIAQEHDDCDEIAIDMHPISMQNEDHPKAKRQILQ